MNANSTSPAASESRERKIIFLLCVLAAIHVFIFSAAFPFFNNVDEPIHFDLVLKYSHGHAPRGLENLSPDSAIYLSLYSSLAYLGTPEKLPGGKFPTPPWKQSVEKMRADLAMNSAAWQEQKNYESAQPPFYYALAGVWWHAGKLLGFEGGRLLYWLRFLNILFIVALVWLSYVAARIVFPEKFFPRIAIPALITFLPQTAFYSIGNDTLSALTFGIAFIFLIQFFRAEIPRATIGAAIGLSLAATFLTKMTNLPLLAVSAIFIAAKLFQLFQRKKKFVAAPAIFALTICGGFPIALWLAWCKIHFGDFTGSKLKMEHLGWTVKPFAEWFHHPIFTPAGFWTFLSGNFTTLWQGEFFWHGQPLALPAIDFIYAILSTIFIAIAFAHFFIEKKNPAPQRQALWLALAAVAAAFAFFGFLSIIYDFHGCFYPSREHPYFTSGRLLLGALIPFLLLFVFGLDCALKKFGNAAKFSALAILILFMLISEIACDWPAFSNDYNWFHL